MYELLGCNCILLEPDLSEVYFISHLKIEAVILTDTLNGLKTVLNSNFLCATHPAFVLLREALIGDKKAAPVTEAASPSIAVC
jgi:hypothetical protein